MTGTIKAKVTLLQRETTPKIFKRLQGCAQKHPRYVKSIENWGIKYISDLARMATLLYRLIRETNTRAFVAGWNSVLTLPNLESKPTRPQHTNQ